MNLHGIANGQITAVNPNLQVTVNVSVGSTVAADGTPIPQYATPGLFAGSISDDELTVTSIAAGVIMIGQTIYDDAGEIAPGTMVTGYGTGDGGPGTYTVSRGDQDVTVAQIKSFVSVSAQVQPMTWRDIQMLDGLNLQGTRKSIYLYGRVDGLVRPGKKGGDQIIMPDGSVWLVGMVLEDWSPTANWTKAAITLQNDAVIGFTAPSDAQPSAVP